MVCYPALSEGASSCFAFGLGFFLHFAFVLTILNDPLDIPFSCHSIVHSFEHALTADHTQSNLQRTDPAIDTQPRSIQIALRGRLGAFLAGQKGPFKGIL